MPDKPFKVIDCLSQGFAVAGPPESPAAGADLEMIHWGLPLDKALALAAELNGDGHRPPLHVRD